MLCFFGGIFQALERQLIFGNVNTLLFFKLGNYPVDNLLIYIIAAKMSIPIGGFYLNDVIATSSTGNIECAPPKSYTTICSFLRLSKP